MSTPAPPQLGQAAAHIEIRKEGEVTVLALMGRLRGPLPSSERDKVLAAVEPGGQLVLDFSRTEDVSGASMRRILMLVRYIRGLGVSVTARAPRINCVQSRRHPAFSTSETIMLPPRYRLPSPRRERGSMFNPFTPSPASTCGPGPRCPLGPCPLGPRPFQAV